MSAPEYVICMECESPCYVFEWADDRLVEVRCDTCGNDEPNQFASEEEYEAMAMGSDQH